MIRRIVVLALLAAACQEPTALRDDIRMSVTDQRPSAVDPLSTTLVFVVINRARVAVYVPRCGDHVATEVEEFKDGSWVNASAALCTTNVRMDPIRLEPGAQFSSSRGIRGTGRFRLRTGVTSNFANEMDWQVFSSDFEVR